MTDLSFQNIKSCTDHLDEENKILSHIRDVDVAHHYVHIGHQIQPIAKMKPRI